MKDQQSEMRTEKSVQDTQRTISHTELLKMKGPYTRAHKTDFCRRCVPTNATVKSMASQNKETIYIVDRGASLHMIGFSSPTCSDRQESTSRRLALLCRYIWRGASPSPLLLGRSCNELGYSVCAWPAAGTHRLSIGKKSLIVASKTSSPWRYQTKNGTIQKSFTSHG